MKPITLAASAVNAKLLDAPDAAKLIVQELLSYKTERGEISAADKWAGRSSMFTYGTGMFPAGFCGLVLAKLKEKGYAVNFVRKPLPPALGPLNPIVDEFGNDDPRYDFQMHTVEAQLKYRAMVAQIATGGGKSKVAKLATMRIGRPTLFLTTRGILMHQMADQVRQLKVPVGIIGDGVWKPIVDRFAFNAGMVQTFDAKLKKDPELVAALLAKFEFVILEEAHEVSSTTFTRMMEMCVNAHYRLALTATPFMKASEEANMRLMAATGPVGIHVPEKLLIDRGILARPTFKFIRFDDPKIEGMCDRYDPDTGKKTGELQPATLTRSMPWPKCYDVGVVHAKKRNGIIVYEARRAASFGLPVMVLVQREAHGQALQTMMTEAGLTANFIYGKHEQSERQAGLAALKDGRLQVLIGSTILDVGVDVPALGMVIIASAGKAEVAMRQRIGRGLRAKKGINRCYIVDFEDWTNSDLKSHSLERRAVINDTPGFAENVLAPGQDFDFVGDGYALRAA
jgi:superfamily II DNA or RNA helicase